MENIEKSFKLDQKSAKKFQVRKQKRKKTKTKKKIIKKVVKRKKVKAAKVKTHPSDYPEIFRQYDQSSDRLWPKFRPFFKYGEEHIFEISHFGMLGAVAKTSFSGEVKIGSTSAYHLEFNLKTVRFYSYIYKLNTKIESFISTDTFVPLKYVLSRRQAKKSTDHLQFFDHKKLKTRFWYKKTRKGKTTEREKSKYTPRYFQDGLGVIYFLRGLPLKSGDRYKFPVLMKDKIWPFEVEVDQTGDIEVMGQMVPAIRAKIRKKASDRRKKEDFIVWFGRGERRRLLSFSLKSKLGTVKGKLVEFTPSR